jgi:hypothetical protein
MLQVENQTPFVPGMFLFPDAAGVDTLYVVLKATFALGPRGPAVAEKQLPLVPADVYWGEPGKSSVRYAGEAHLSKPASDVVVVGAAHAPGGKPAPSFGVSFAVGRLRKVVHVHGERVWVGGPAGMSPSPPVPAASVPLLWERAFGGQEELGGGTVLSEPSNPVGTGFRGKRAARELDGTPLPNLEHPAHPLRSPSDRPPPCGVGFVAPSWQPRAAHAGTYDEAWQKRRAPYLPADFDPRFLQAAPADQIYPGFLQGGEPVELLNLSPAGPLKFALPVCEPAVEVEVAGAEVRPRLAIETLLLEPDQGRFSLLWRGAVPCDKKALQISKASFELGRLAGVAP